MEKNIIEIIELLKEEPKTIHQLSQESEIPIETVKIILDELKKEEIIQSLKVTEETYFVCQSNRMEEDDEKEEILRLHREIVEMNKQIEINERNSKESLNKVHEYNDIKDIGQMLLGRLGQLENKTIQQLYEEYNIDVND